MKASCCQGLPDPDIVFGPIWVINNIFGIYYDTVLWQTFHQCGRVQLVDVVVPQCKSRSLRPSESCVSEEQKHRSVIMTFSKLSLALVLVVTISGLNAYTFRGQNECKLDQLIKAKYEYNLCWVWSEYRVHKMMLFTRRI